MSTSVIIESTKTTTTGMITEIIEDGIITLEVIIDQDLIITP